MSDTSVIIGEIHTEVIYIYPVKCTNHRRESAGDLHARDGNRLSCRNRKRRNFGGAYEQIIGLIRFQLRLPGKVVRLGYKDLFIFCIFRTRFVQIHYTDRQIRSEFHHSVLISRQCSSCKISSLRVDRHTVAIKCIRRCRFRFC